MLILKNGSKDDFVKILLTLWVFLFSLPTFANLNSWQSFSSKDAMDDSYNIGTSIKSENQIWPYQANVSARCSDGDFQFILNRVGYVGSIRFLKFRADNNSPISLFVHEGTNNSLFIKDAINVIAAIKKSSTFLIRVRKPDGAEIDWKFNGMGFNKSFRAAENKCGKIASKIKEARKAEEDSKQADIERKSQIKNEVKNFTNYVMSLAKSTLKKHDFNSNGECTITFSTYQYGFIPFGFKGDDDLCGEASVVFMTHTSISMPKDHEVNSIIRGLELKIKINN